MGICPVYSVAISTKGIVFDGRGFVVAEGKHADSVDADDVRKFAKRLAHADFYSMEDSYTAPVTAAPTYILTASIDGRRKQIVDYQGTEEGMPAVVAELEKGVDSLARTQRWINGDDGLVPALQAEEFDFHAVAAQIMLKEAASRGKTATVQQFLKVGVPLESIPSNKIESETPLAMPFDTSFEPVGLLTSASHHPESLQLLIGAGASRSDQQDKDLALAGAAGSGSVDAAQALMHYGANPNADLSSPTIARAGGGMRRQEPVSGSILIYAARSGNPAMIREILKYHPDLEVRNREGETALFSVGRYPYIDTDRTLVECVRLLAEAGANINARDNDGNTPLHKISFTDVEQKLLELGADVNARNNDGETPIFTTSDDDAIPLFMQHGADLTLRNGKGETVVEAAESRGPLRLEALRKAIQEKSVP